MQIELAVDAEAGIRKPIITVVAATKPNEPLFVFGLNKMLDDSAKTSVSLESICGSNSIHSMEIKTIYRDVHDGSTVNEIHVVARASVLVRASHCAHGKHRRV